MDNYEISFTLNLRVYSVRSLLKAAAERAKADGLSRADWREYRSTRHSGLAACVQMLLDPGTIAGCEINDSDAQQIEA